MHLRALAGSFLLSTFCVIGVGCAVQREADDEPDEVTETETQAVRPTTLRFDALRRANLEPGGLPLFASNNPETVHTYGILASTVRESTATRSIGARNNWVDTPEGIDATLEGKNTVLQRGCPAGSLKEFGVYAAHILAGATRDGYVSFAVVGDPDRDVELELEGELGWGPWARTRQADFISSQVVRETFFDGAPKKTVRVPKGAFRQISVSRANGGYLDGRMRAKVVGTGCVTPYFVAHASAALTALPSTFATGNIAWPGWYRGGGEGRSAGVYANDRFVGRETFVLTEPSGATGVRLASSEQAARALVRHKDSARIHNGNYGALYDETLEITNGSGPCREVLVEFVSFAATSGGAPVFGAYQGIARRDLPTVYWNGPIAKYLGTTGRRTMDQAILFVDEQTYQSQPATALVPTMRKVLHSVLVNPGRTARLRYEIPVPGLITAPAGIVVTYAPCRS
jgi:hypothetical protein